MGDFKDKTGQTRVGAFLKNVAPDLLNIAGDITGISAISNIGDIIKGTDKLTEDQKQAALGLLELDLKDRNSARELQKTALNQTDLFSKRFIYYLAGFVMITTVILLFSLFFVEIPEKNSSMINMAIGVFLGVTGSVATYFFGSSVGSKEKQTSLDKLIK